MLNLAVCSDDLYGHTRGKSPQTFTYRQIFGTQFVAHCAGCTLTDVDFGSVSVMQKQCFLFPVCHCVAPPPPPQYIAAYMTLFSEKMDRLVMSYFNLPLIKLAVLSHQKLSDWKPAKICDSLHMYRKILPQLSTEATPTLNKKDRWDSGKPRPPG